MYISTYLLVWAALTSLTNLFCYFCGFFCYQEMLFGNEFSMAEVFYREHWSNLYHKLQNKSKIESKEPISVRRRVNLLLLQVMCWKCLSVWLLAVKTVLVSQCYMKVSFIPFLGLLCDLLWSDPDKDTNGWGENDRGVSFTFGADVVSKFLNRHDLDLICRAHQVS